MKQFNGHRSWSAWNVCLHITNDEALHNAALFCIKQAIELRDKARAEGKFAASSKVDVKAAMLLKALVPERTPDGARYSYLNLKLTIGLLLARTD